MKAKTSGRSRTWGVAAGIAVLLLIPAARGADDEEGGGPAIGKEELLDLLKSIIEEDALPPPSVLGDVDPMSAPAEVKRAVRVLRETRVDLSFEEQGIQEVLKVLREVSGLNFAIGPKAKAALGEERPKVTLSLRGLPLENVLNLLALQLGEYRFTLRYGMVYLIRNEEYRPVKVFRIYNVTDLISARPDFPAPRLALESPEEKR